MTETTPNLALPEIAAAQAQKHVTHNEALRVLDAVIHLAVLDRDLVAPPDSPAEGQRWLVGTPASGDWASHDDEIAAWQDGGWQFYQPHVGWLAYVMDEAALLAWSGTAWAPALDLLGGATELQNMALLGAGTTADETNPFSAKLNNALWAARPAAEGGDGDLRYKLSKEAEANTLSLLLQNDFSGRAEIGLTGDDDFHFKVSDDGTTWRDAIVIDKGTGQVSFPQGGASSDLELTMAELALGLADALNAAQFLGDSGNRVADSFDALTYVDVAGATNLDTGTAGLLKPTCSLGADQIPAMTAGTTSGVTISASSEAVAGEEAWRAGDNSTATHWRSSTSLPAWWQVDLGSAKTITDVTMQTRSGSPNQSPQSFTVLGSSTGAFSGEQATLLTASDLSWSDLETKTFTIGSPGSYRYYRLAGMTTVLASQVSFSEISVRLASLSDNLACCSADLTAAATPSSARLVARVKEIDSIALNTDLVFSASRDGGTSWSTFTVAKRFTAAGVSVYDSSTLDISGQPSGVAMKWKMETANNKSVEVCGIYFSWS
jgi:hypothetical protein